MPKERAPLLACILLALAALSCGLEDVPYISQLPQASSTAFNKAEIALALSEGAGSGGPFENFVIFYKIYLSALGTDNTIDERLAINSTLNADYNFFAPLVSGSTTSSTLWSVFANRGFMGLELEGASAAGVLGSTSLGQTLSVEFSQEIGVPPGLTVGGSAHALRRAERSGNPSISSFNPAPRIEGRLPFFNHEQLLLRANATADINADVVAAAASVSEENVRHAYALMYIVASGANWSTLPPIRVFSRPTFLGIFTLPPAQ
ncbi:MAG: hypothetical protein FWE09_04830 [Treponema sp.]|nr:hypothetical protein [Treponema sp.]